ncbi:MAG: uracil-DNA glycosylase family protein [Bacteroidales bacterium]|jgi:DNA polymerase
MNREFSLNNTSNFIDTSNRIQCKACGLYLNQLPVLDRQDKAGIFWVGLSSVLIGKEEEKQPLSPFTRSGALIKEIENPYTSKISFYKTNVVKCLPLVNNKIRYPFKHEMEKCFPNLETEIEILKPSIVFLLGKQVATFVLKKLSIGDFSLDENFNYSSFLVNKIRYVPVHHPSFVLVYKRKFIQDYINGISSCFKSFIINNKTKSQLHPIC